ncbi:MAG TPA: SMC-Scp complex subunit ScpB [Chloroflexi bacterium]|nr:MAG: SMC-Scp complex subunit ScpB [Chloroflexota bacterium]HDN04926.1 SMC-Scp complex subunit ScpB [Chloroflexota bacterium]
MTEEKYSETNEKQDLSLSALVEAILFVSPEPITAAQISTLLELTPREVKNALEELESHYQGRGIRLQYHKKKIQITSAPEAAPILENMLELETTSTLSQAALETLSIVAYQQPITRPQVDSIRGVNSDGVLRTLLNKGLIDDVGRAEGPGRPILYSTTTEFLKHFGLSSYEELPPLDFEEIQPTTDPKVLKG